MDRELPTNGRHPAPATVARPWEGMENDVDRLRSERDEWRRRAEVAEAVAAERLSRAETAERALRAAETALAGAGEPADSHAGGPSGGPPPAEPRRPASLLERWRRYTDTLN